MNTIKISTPNSVSFLDRPVSEGEIMDIGDTATIIIDNKHTIKAMCVPYTGCSKCPVFRQMSDMGYRLACPSLLDTGGEKICGRKGMLIDLSEILEEL